MKKMSRFLALATALVMLLALCACGGGTRSANTPDFETIMQEAQEKMGEVKSMHMDMDMDLSMELGVMGQNQKLDMRVYYSLDVQTEPARSKLVITTSAMGQSQEMTMYTDEDGMAYLSTDGRNWQRSSASQAEETMGGPDPGDTLELFTKNASSFTKTGSETINGSPATVYSGVLSGEYVEEVLKTTGMDSSLGSLLGTEDLGDAFKELGEIPMTIAIDDASGLVGRYTLDMAQVMENLMKNLFTSILASQGMSGINIEIKLDKCMCTATLSQFNSVPEIVIPDEAKG